MAIEQAAGQLKSRAAKTGSESSDSNEVSSKTKPLAGSRPAHMAPMLVLLAFSTAMLTLPLGTYFVIRNYILKSTAASAMGAIVVVQIIVAVYIYKAWHDENIEHERQMKEKLKKR